MGLAGRVSDWSNWHFNGNCFIVGQCFSNRTRQASCVCVWSRTDTTTAARRCIMPRYDLSRQVHTSMSRWALVLLRHRCFQVFGSIIPRKSSHFLNLTDHESFFQWHAMQRSRFLNPFSVRIMCSSAIGALPTQIPCPHLDPDRLLAQMCTCTSLFFRMATLDSCTLPKRTTTNAKNVSTRYSLNAFVGQSVADKLLEPTSTANA